MNLSNTLLLRTIVILSNAVMYTSLRICFANHFTKSLIRQSTDAKLDRNKISFRRPSTDLLFTARCLALASKICVVEYEAEFGQEFTRDMMNNVATELSVRLAAPLVRQEVENKSHFSFGLYIVPYKHANIESYAIGIDSLESQIFTKKRLLSPAADAFFVELCPLTENRLVKRSKGHTGKDLLVKAVAPNRMRLNGASILDLTAGFGQDSLILAHSGASKVQMVEHNPIVSTLLGDALRRLHLLTGCNDDEVRERALHLSQRLTLTEGEGSTEASRIAQTDILEHRPDVCYLDPMFPPRAKSAKVKKGMQLLHGLLDSQNISTDPLLLEQTEAELLMAAYAAAVHRVVVKRPKNAPLFGGTTLVPSHQISGSVNRWDVYMKK